MAITTGSAAASDTDGVTVVVLQTQHVASLARAHAACFPGFFLTNLGVDFLEVYYDHCLASPYGFGAAAVDRQGKVLAFAIGVTELDGQDSALLRRHAGRVIRTIATRWFVDPDVRKQVRERFRRFIRILGRSLHRQDPQEAKDVREVIPYATLTSIGVLPEMRGHGLAEGVLQGFENEVRSRGYRAIRAATSMDNHRALAFYRKNGWYVESVRPHENGTTLEKLLDQPEAANKAS